jgi:hypothetical protein
MVAFNITSSGQLGEYVHFINVALRSDFPEDLNP